MTFKHILQNYKNVSRIGCLDLIFSMTKEGIASFLILYLIQTLQLSDAQAYAFVGLKEVVSYIIPFLAAILVSSFVSAAQGALMGMVLMGLGCFILALPSIEALNIGFGFFLFGYGLGKPTFPLLVAMKQDLDREEKDTRIRYLYTFGNTAAFIAPFLMGLLGGIKTWHYSFNVLGSLCLLGSVLSYMILKQENLLQHTLFHDISFKKGMAFLILPFVFSLPFFFPVLKTVFLVGSGVWVLMFFYRSWTKFTLEEKDLFKKLLMIFGSIIIFFAFQTLEYTLFPVYVERFVDRTLFSYEIKTPWFHMVAPLLSIIAAPLLIKLFHQHKTHMNSLIVKKINISFLMLFLSYLGMYVSTFLLNKSLYMVLLSYGLFFVGSFLLIPTSQEIMSRFKSNKIKRILMGILFLTMACARFIGSLLSQKFGENLSFNTMTISAFEHSFYLLSIILYGLFCIISIFFLIHKIKERRRNLSPY